ncbi:DUF7507 domain-containing protein [Streptomyces violascens]|uniref:DUF7507 domain-containing protein n=1 Tax=Streptomyces violascens TaxID=67381 RepID=UPI0036954AB3
MSADAAADHVPRTTASAQAGDGIGRAMLASENSDKPGAEGRGAMGKRLPKPVNKQAYKDPKRKLAAGERTAALAPTTNEFPTSWAINSPTSAAGKLPSGEMVTATLTGPVTFFVAEPTGRLVLTGATPKFLPVTADALRFDLRCETSTPSGCGTITYKFSRPVTTPVLYTGDVGASGANTKEIWVLNHPQTLLSGGTFSADAPGAQTSNMSSRNGGAAIGLTNPAGEVGLPTDSNSCGSVFGCGAYALTLPTASVTSLSFGLGYEGTASSRDVFTQLLGVTPVPPPTITKEATKTSFVAGETVNYTLRVMNPSTVTLANLSVKDNDPGSSAVSCPVTTLAANASTTCTVTYTASAADAATGFVKDTASVSGTTPDGTALTATSNQVNIPVRALMVTKSAAEADFKGPVESIHYTYTVTNTGQTPLTNVHVTELAQGAAVSGCGTSRLAPGESTACQAVYVTTAADVALKNVPDQGRAIAAAPAGEMITADSNKVNTPLNAISVAKQASKAHFTAAGQTIEYTYTVTNTGLQTLTGVLVVDNGPGTPAVNCPVGSLAPDSSTTCTATYVTTQADVDAGKVTDIATVTARTPNGATVTSTSNRVTIVACAPCKHKHHADCAGYNRGHTLGYGDQGQDRMHERHSHGRLGEGNSHPQGDSDHGWPDDRDVHKA